MMQKEHNNKTKIHVHINIHVPPAKTKSYFFLELFHWIRSKKQYPYFLIEKASIIMVLTVGVDFGSQKTIVVADDGEIVRTDTGSISVPTLVSFVQQSRYVGDEAASYPVGNGRISLLNLACGDTPAQLLAPARPHEAFFAHSPTAFQVDETTSAAIYHDIQYCDSPLSISAVSLLAVLIGQQARRIEEVYGPERRLAFVLPNGAGPIMARNVTLACAIAGVPKERVVLVGAVEALTAAYTRKIGALRPADKAALQGKHIVFAEMGHTQTTIVCLKILPNEDPKVPDRVQPLAVESSNCLGAMSFDICLFNHFCGVVEKKYGEKIVAGSKRGHRLMAGCERIRKLLSQLTEAQVTIENLTDSGDVHFSLKRDELAAICAAPLQQLRALVNAAVAASYISVGDNSVFVEILGGGMRMQVAQQVLFDIFGENTHMGAKFDDGSAALGGALVANHTAELKAAAIAATFAATETPITSATPADEASSTEEGSHSVENLETVSMEIVDESENTVFFTK